MEEQRIVLVKSRIGTGIEPKMVTRGELGFATATLSQKEQLPVEFYDLAEHFLFHW